MARYDDSWLVEMIKDLPPETQKAMRVATKKFVMEITEEFDKT